MGVCDVPVIHEVCNAAGDAAGAVITAPFEWLAQGMGGAAEWMFTSVWTVIHTTTFVEVTSGEYTKVYAAGCHGDEEDCVTEADRVREGFESIARTRPRIPIDHSVCNVECRVRRDHGSQSRDPCDRAGEPPDGDAQHEHGVPPTIVDEGRVAAALSHRPSGSLSHTGHVVQAQPGECVREHTGPRGPHRPATTVAAQSNRASSWSPQQGPRPISRPAAPAPSKRSGRAR